MSDHEKLILLGAGLVAAFCFLPWWSVSFDMGGLPMESFRGGSANGFDFTEGTLTFLFSLAAIGSVLAHRARAIAWTEKTARLVTLAGCGAALVCLIIVLGRGGASQSFGTISSGRTVWFYASLVLMGLAGWVAFQRVQEKLPSG
jgi:hypothetical protein